MTTMPLGASGPTAASAATPADESPVVATLAGRVRGSWKDGVARFLGIPYAAAPFGVHRFEAPAPVAAWDGVRDAREFGPTAPKGPFNPPLDRLLPEPVIEGDDCLNLNVWTPGLGDGGRRPVMVWIHGGSLKNGSSAADVYDGHSFARDGVVLVSINYRLGVEGFAVFPDAPANRGLLDQIAALRWVRDNIAAFGGDPNNVTVFGQSAGAICIAALLVSPYAEGLFRRAIMQSGPPTAVSRQEGARITDVIAKALKVPATAKAFAAAERGRLLAGQIAATSKGNPLFGGAGFQIVVDGDVVRQDPMTALRNGAARDIDLMVGYTRDEYRLWFVPSGLVDRVSTVTLRLALLKFRIPGRIARRYRGTYPDAKPGEILGRIAGDMLMRAPAHRLADSRLGQSNTFMYEFAWPTTVERLGSCHALEIGFAFDTLDRAGSLTLTGPNPPQALADAMHGAWVEFARTGDPGWNAWTAERPLMRFDVPTPALAHTSQDDEVRSWL
jgi:para-nitrobenzyl esterase